MCELDQYLLLVLAESFERCAGENVSVEVALSGGLDSVVLLHLLKRLREIKRFSLSAVHVHHGLQKEADGWPLFCEDLCKTWQIALRKSFVQPNTTKVGIEAGAREARYAAFAESKAEFVALGHHRDDQVETFVLSALRGAGVRGLASMPEKRAFDKDKVLWRPLLTIPRQKLADYAKMHDLPYIEDPSNGDGSLLRNWLRNSGLPVWRNRLPMLDRHIASSIRVLQGELSILEEVADADWSDIHHDGFFDCKVWRRLSPARRVRQLVMMTQQSDVGIPSQSSLDDFSRILCEIGTGFAQWDLPGGKIYAYQNRLFGLKKAWREGLPWLDSGCLSGSSDWSLGDSLVAANFNLRRRSYGLCENVLGKKGRVRAVDTDDVIELTVGHKKVRKLLQECKIPPFVRAYWPVITNEENHCIAVANLWVNPSYACLNGIFPCFEKFSCFVLEPK